MSGRAAFSLVQLSHTQLDQVEQAMLDPEVVHDVSWCCVLFVREMCESVCGPGVSE